MKRLLLGAAVSVVVTFFLFVFMAFLVKPSSAGQAAKGTKLVEFTIVRPKETENLKKRTPPKKPEPPKEPPPPEMAEQVDRARPNVTFNVDLPKVETGLVGGGLYLGNLSNSGNMGDGDAIPMVVIQPTYPRKALMEGIEGFVRLKFTIMPDGSPKDVVIVEAKPRRIFEREALRAVYKWKFKPRVVDGKPVEQPNMYYTMQFKLEQ